MAGGPTLTLIYDAVGNIETRTVTNSAEAADNVALTLLYGGSDGRVTEIQGDLAATVVYDANGAIRKLEYPVTSDDLMNVSLSERLAGVFARWMRIACRRGRGLSPIVS